MPETICTHCGDKVGQNGFRTGMILLYKDNMKVAVDGWYCKKCDKPANFRGWAAYPQEEMNPKVFLECIKQDREREKHNGYLFDVRNDVEMQQMIRNQLGDRY